MDLGGVRMPIAQGVSKSSDDSRVLFVHSSHGGYELDTRTWRLQPLDALGRPVAVHDGTRLAVMEGDEGNGAIVALGKARWQRVRIVSVIDDSGIAITQTKLFKTFFSVGLGLTSFKNRNVGKKIDLEQKAVSGKEPTVNVEIVTKRRFDEHLMVLDLARRRWVKPVVVGVPDGDDSGDPSLALLALGDPALVPYKNKLLVMGGDRNANRPARVLVFERRNVPNLAAQLEAQGRAGANMVSNTPAVETSTESSTQADEKKAV